MTKMIFHAFGVLRLESCSNFLERIHLLQLLTITTTLATAQLRNHFHRPVPAGPPSTWLDAAFLYKPISNAELGFQLIEEHFFDSK